MKVKEKWHGQWRVGLEPTLPCSPTSLKVFLAIENCGTGYYCPRIHLSSSCHGKMSWVLIPALIVAILAFSIKEFSTDLGNQDHSNVLTLPKYVVLIKRLAFSNEQKMYSPHFTSLSSHFRSAFPRTDRSPSSSFL